ncbi:anaerobic sulfatase maturase [Maridesulfovibrio sp.]|uniref:anaerobic sulfatase maturase n=1 Tax=unclassified Maridesulfovibrio TaxID=2794999 RepID=UPI003AFFC714
MIWESMRKPLQTILIKPTGPDCNMACSYCFYLDKSSLFKETPTYRMSGELLEELIRQAMNQSGEQVSFIWQGGEPTLMGLDFYRRCIELQQKYGQRQTVGNGLQTNGLLINEDWISFLKKYPWLVGLSLDGPEHVHDHYRRSRKGKGTWGKVSANAKEMLSAGLAVNALIVVNDHSVRFADEIYEYHKNLGLTHMQFIPCVETDRNDPSRLLPFSVPAEKYGHFLCRIFDNWMDDFYGRTPTTSVRMFESLFHLYIGYPAPECTLLKECGCYITVEHNGDVFCCDFYVQPEWHLGNIRQTSLTEMLNSKRQSTFGYRKACLPKECTKCRWLPLCRAGCPKDRLGNTKGKPSNYLCPAYKIFFEHADQRLRRLAQVWKKQYSASQVENRRADMTYDAKTGRNQPCPCGSGKKYKRCCGS